ncbi:MAG: DNA gyrase inhibitor YacG [Sedimentisphaerales bacterium]|jgi:endogenous inhibitor of DNA gyrase (YacG/DUF329 family)
MSSKIGKTAGFISGRENGKLEDDMKSRCPVCRKVMDETTRQSSREGGFYPFCCNRCRMIDLGKWFDGDYRIPVEVRPEEAEDISEETAKRESSSPERDKAEND